MAVLAAAAGLLGVLHLAVGRTGQRFLVGDLRTCRRVASTLNSRFRRSTMISRCSSPMPAMTTWPVCWSVFTRKRRVFGHQLAEADCRASPDPTLVFGSIASEMTGSGKSIDSSTIGFFSSQIVSPVVTLLQADRRGDVARVDFLDLFALVGVHLQQAADPLGASAWSRCRRDDPAVMTPE